MPSNQYNFWRQFLLMGLHFYVFFVNLETFLRFFVLLCPHRSKPDFWNSFRTKGESHSGPMFDTFGHMFLKQKPWNANLFSAAILEGTLGRPGQPNTAQIQWTDAKTDVPTFLKCRFLISVGAHSGRLLSEVASFWYTVGHNFQVPILINVRDIWVAQLPPDLPPQGSSKSYLAEAK